MVHDLVFHECLVGILLGLGICIYGWWLCSPATKPRPTHRTKGARHTSQSFAGLTQKPHCQTYEQKQPNLDRPPLASPLMLAPKRGRPRTIDPHAQYCPMKTCAY
jgi:hypothetical protein